MSSAGLGFFVLLLLVTLPGCERHAGNTPRAARFVVQHKLEGRLSTEGPPWSPSGRRLVMETRRGLVVFDAASPEVEPRVVYPPARVRSFVWSPQGDRLLLKVGLNRIGDVSLVVASVALDDADTLVIANHLGAITWVEDGRIGYKVDSAVHWVLPESDEITTSTASKHDSARVLVTGLQWLVPGDSAAHPFGSPLRESPQDFLADMLPGGEAYLIRSLGGHVPEAAVLDSKGRVRWNLNEVAARFTPETLSIDGLLLAGVASKDDGHELLEAKLYVADVQGRWIMPLANAPNGITPRFAREGRLFAYQDPFYVYVGLLECPEKQPLRRSS